MKQENVSQAERDLNDIEIIDVTKEPLTQAEKQKKKRSKIIWIIIFVAVNILVIGYTAIHEFGNKSPEKLSVGVGATGVLFILAGFGCLFLSLAFETLKYITMMKGLKVKVSVKAAFQTAALGRYYDNITPSGIGGQPFQIYNMHKHGYSNGVSVAMPLTQFVMMQTAFIILAVIMVITKIGNVDAAAMNALVYVGIVFYAAAPLLIILFTVSRSSGIAIISLMIRFAALIRLVKKPEDRIKSIVRSLDEYRDSMLMIGKNRGVLLITFVLSLCYQLALFSIPYFVLMAFNGSANYLETVFMVCFVYCACTIVPTPGNAGAAEGSFYVIFSQLDPAGLFWSMLVWRVICYYTPIVIGIGVYGYNGFVDRMKRRRQRLREKAETIETKVREKIGRKG